MKLFNETFGLIEKAMDLQFRRHSLLSGNIANSETPNYKARDLDFANELKNVLQRRGDEELNRTSTLHMGTSAEQSAHVVTDYTGSMGADGNNVDLDVSMGKLSENARSYSGATSWLGVQLRLLKTAARGRIGG